MSNEENRPRPARSRPTTGRIPRGIEVLVSKASVDPAFKAILLERRAQAAEAIGLKLDPSETTMLAGVPQPQLEAIIARTRVPQEHRRAFLGKAAAVMLAAVGLMTPGCDYWAAETPKGIRPDVPPTDEPAPEGVEEPEPGDVPPETPPEAREPDDADAEPPEGREAEPPESGEEEVPPPSDENVGPNLPDPASGLPPESPPVIRGIRPDVPPQIRGIRPDRIPVTKGIRPDVPPRD